MIYILYIERTVYRHVGYVKILFVYYLQEIKLCKLYFLKVIITENKVLVLSLLYSQRDQFRWFYVYTKLETPLPQSTSKLSTLSTNTVKSLKRLHYMFLMLLSLVLVKENGPI